MPAAIAFPGKTTPPSRWTFRLCQIMVSAP